MTGPLRGHDAPVSATFVKRFVFVLSIVDALGAVLLLTVLYLALSRPIAGDYAAVFLGLRGHVSSLRPLVAFAALAYVVLVGLATACLCVTALQKIAGPLYRMERLIERYVDGEAPHAAFFREADQVKALATAFNAFVARLREDRKSWLATMAQAERLCLQDRATCRIEMEKALAEVEVLLAKYR